MELGRQVTLSPENCSVELCIHELWKRKTEVFMRLELHISQLSEQQFSLRKIGSKSSNLFKMLFLAFFSYHLALLSFFMQQIWQILWLDRQSCSGGECKKWSKLDQKSQIEVFKVRFGHPQCLHMFWLLV